MNKLILTHRGALTAKYGSSLPRIEAALQRMVAADAARGVITLIEFLDRAKPLGTTKVKRASDARSVQQAVHRLCQHHGEPDYVMLLGAPDIVPHQPLANPLPLGDGQDGDPDAEVWSDLPYACSRGYSTKIKDFLGPTRAVGRLPDLQGTADADYLIGLIDAAASHQAPTKLSKGMGIAAKVWTGATRRVLRQGVGSVTRMRVSPRQNAPVPTALLKSPLQLINCHGGLSDPQFYGDDGDDPDLPVALTSANVRARIEGAVIAAECCYGADLYEPRRIPRSICNAYLGQGAVGFMGSTTVAYGAFDSPLECADVICAHFLELVRGGASLGSALLEARLKFLSEVKPYSGIELKTIAQFLLLGDPSLRAVSLATRTTATRRGPARREAPRTQLLQQHTAHRKQLAAVSHQLQGWAESKQLRVLSVPAKESIRRNAKSAAAAHQLLAWVPNVDTKRQMVVEAASVRFTPVRQTRVRRSAGKTTAKGRKASQQAAPRAKQAQRAEVVVTKFRGGTKTGSARLARR